MRKPVEWTPEMIDRLIFLYPSEASATIAAILNVGRTTLCRKATELGLEKGLKRSWLERAELVRNLYQSYSVSEISAKTSIPKRTVSRIISKLGLSKSAEERREINIRVRVGLLNRERRRIIFRLEPITNLKVTTDRRVISMKHRLKKRGYIVERSSNIIRYHAGMERDPQREAAARKLGLKIKPIDESHTLNAQ